MIARASVIHAVASLATWTLLGCGKEDPRFFYEKKPIPGLPYQGFRQDIPNERRGNRAFVKAVFTPEGRYLVTLGPGIQVWDAATGAMLRTLPATLDGNDPLVAMGRTIGSSRGRGRDAHRGVDGTAVVPEMMDSEATLHCPT
jgi:hypothetical protein